MEVVEFERYKRRRKKRNFNTFVPVIYILLIVVGLYFFIHSPFFNIKEIYVIGNNLLSAETIINLGQVNKGQNLILLNKDEIIEKISVHPLIKEVKIKRKIPNTLNIVVEERKPVGLLVCQDGFIQVSENGYFLALINDLKGYNLPVISGIELEQLPGPGQIIKNEGLYSALNLIKLSPIPLLEKIAEINVGLENYILAYTLKGIEIRIGSSENLQQKINNLQEILEDIEKRGLSEENIEYIDLRFSGPPVIKKKLNKS